jgi:integrase
MFVSQPKQNINFMNAAENSKTAPKPLSAKAIEKLKPGTPIKADIGENAGLRVKCGSTGIKTFFYRYKSPETDKLTQIKIGNYPSVSLAEARVELAKLKNVRKSGICPKAEKLRLIVKEKALVLQAQQLASSTSFTVEGLVELYLVETIEDRFVPDKKDPTKRKLIAGSRKPKGQAEARRTLYGDAVRVLGSKSANKVTRKDVVEMVMEIVRRGANVQAGHVVRELTSAYEYAIGLGRFDDEFANPALLAKASLKQAKVKMRPAKGKRVLTDQELKTVLQWLPGSGFSSTQKNILWLTLWTGCRTGEICEAEWRDIDLEKETWHIRNSKNGAERYVQLSRQAVAIIQKLKLDAEDGYLFPSRITGKPIQQKSLTEIKWQLKNADSLPNRRKYSEAQRWLTSIDDWSPHDLRRTVRTGLSRLRCPSDVAEAVLGHSAKGIVGTYNLHDYERECKEWLQKWGDYVDRLM